MKFINKYFRSEDFQILKEVLILFLGWRIILLFITYFGLSLLPKTVSHNEISWATPSTDYFLKWANWDGGHFRGIAENGYLTFQVVFFPLYPLLIKTLMLISIPSLWGGLFISNFSIILALFFLYKLVNLDFEKSIARKVIFITLAFPTAFYFGAVYSESLFLLLTVSSFYFTRKKKWVAALILASLAAITRFTGLIVILCVALEYYLKTDQIPSPREYWSSFLNRIATYILALAFSLSILQKVFTDNGFFMLAGLSKTTAIFLAIMGLILLIIFIVKFSFNNIDFKKLLQFSTLLFLLSLLPFLSYCLFLYYTQDSFFAFITHEKQWERHLSLPWSASINYFNSLLTVGIFTIGPSAQKLIELLFFIFFAFLLIISYLKLRLSYTVFFALSILIPISTGTLEAIHRYGLVIFPVFILLAQIKNESYYQIWIFFSLTLLGILSVLFINSYWVT